VSRAMAPEFTVADEGVERAWQTYGTRKAEEALLLSGRVETDALRPTRCRVTVRALAPWHISSKVRRHRHNVRPAKFSAIDIDEAKSAWKLKRLVSGFLRVSGRPLPWPDEWTVFAASLVLANVLALLDSVIRAIFHCAGDEPSHEN